MPTYHDRNLGPGRIREDANENLYPEPRDAHAIISERQDIHLHNQIDAAREKARLFEEARALARQQIAAEQAQAARESYYTKMRPRLLAQGILSYEVERVLSSMYEEEVRGQIRDQDAATRTGAGLAARYAL